MALQLTRDMSKPQPIKLLINHDYKKVGFNSSLEVSPSIVHFGGFKIHQIHKAEIKIINISKVSARLHIIGPTTPYFKIKYDKKVKKILKLSLSLSLSHTHTHTPCLLISGVGI